MTNEERLLTRWIDNASYYDLLKRWRFAPMGDNMFVGDVGNYYASIMAEKKRELSEEEQTQVSKSIGW